MYFILYSLPIFCVFALTVIFEYKLIPVLKHRAKQPIYEDGPHWHLSKNGTPTMGGLGFLLASLVVLLSTSLILLKTNNQIGIALFISLIYTVANSLIGVIDDLTKIHKKENAGLTPMQKIFFQLIFAVLFLMTRAHFLEDTTILQFSFGNIDIGFLYYPLAIIILLGIINCANLTDGIDGLASSVSLAIGISLMFMCSNELSDVGFIASSLIGASLGFLLFNIHPAKIFMGDTGSLFLGALAVCCSFSLKNPMLMLFLGGVYVIEGISVISQVVYFKITGKRLFKMAPLHHHLEKCGMSECKICMIAIIITFLLALSILLIKAI